jgi:23S rRNA (pseudouridine1915-N3)-methyltransferase
VLIIAVGQRMPAWVDQAYNEYAKRMPPELRLDLREIKAQARSGAATATILAKEAEAIRQALPKRARLIVLDEHGQATTSSELAALLKDWQRQGDPIAFVIGSADGIDGALKKEAHQLLRLSSLTLPHALVRVLLAEQLYRASSINQGHPYHRP